MERSKSSEISLIAIFGALAAAVSIGLPSFPFPILRFLKFDPAEIIDTIAFLILGPTPGLIVAILHWFTLNLGAPTVPVFGPLMKLSAVSSMFLGFWLASLMLMRISAEKPVTGKLGFAVLLGLGIFSRVVIMAFLTFILYYILLPETYLKLASSAFAAVNVKFTTPLEVALATVGLTALFNLAHTPISLLPSLALSKYILYHPRISALNPWIVRYLRF